MEDKEITQDLFIDDILEEGKPRKKALKSKSKGKNAPTDRSLSRWAMKAYSAQVQERRWRNPTWNS